MADGDPGGAGARRRIGGGVVGGLVVVWVLVGAALVSIIGLEAITLDDRCPVPGVVETYGEVSWQAWPPGEICTFEGAYLVEPSPLRGWAILFELALGGVLFLVWGRARNAPDPDWAA
jgi:hypothetical protein